MKRLILLLALLASLSLVAAACGDDDDTSTDDSGDDDSTDDDETTPSDGEDADADDGEGALDGASDPDAVSHTEMTPEELEVWQTDLNAVGCYVGAVDGAEGPKTEAAVRAFQAAKDLTVDGLLGPNTEGALQEAVAAGETVCTTSDGDTDTGDAVDDATAVLTSSGYGPKEFTVGSCTNAGETDLVLQAQVDNLTLLVDAPDGSGTLSVDGGTESDGITLNGDVASVTVGDAGNFTVTGTFTEPNNVGEEFTLTGSCAGA